MKTPSMVSVHRDASGDELMAKSRRISERNRRTKMQVQQYGGIRAKTT
jgi:hypothetical protein